MSKVRLYGSTSGYIEVQAPAVASDSTVTLPNGPFDFEAGYRYAGTRYFTSDGTFLKADPLGTGDIGLRAIRVRCVGGGGGGGGAAATGASQNAIGRGGGGGGYAERFFTDIASLDTLVTVTRGAGGTAGAAGNNAGAEGGVSQFGGSLDAWITRASGGAGGGGGVAAGLGGFLGGAAAGDGEQGDLLLAGSQSTAVQYIFASSVVGSIPGSAAGGFGTYLSAGTTSGSNGTTGRLYGGGGGGGLNVQNQATAKTGGAGGNGIVIVDCFV